uniref:Uncharacterized protein n=1 Tax=Rhizophora mucronata TaxID=61149 RepID=A0A2P2N9P8_RHIMU
MKENTITACLFQRQLISYWNPHRSSPINQSFIIEVAIDTSGGGG